MRLLQPIVSAAILMTVAACASAPLQQRGHLASYDGMAEASGPRTKARIRFDLEALGRAQTAHIATAAFAPSPTATATNSTSRETSPAT